VCFPKADEDRGELDLFVELESTVEREAAKQATSDGGGDGGGGGGGDDAAPAVPSAFASTLDLVNTFVDAALDGMDLPPADPAQTDHSGDGSVSVAAASAVQPAEGGETQRRMRLELQTSRQEAEEALSQMLHLRSRSMDKGESLPSPQPDGGLGSSPKGAPVRTADAANAATSAPPRAEIDTTAQGGSTAGLDELAADSIDRAEQTAVAESSTSGTAELAATRRVEGGEAGADEAQLSHGESERRPVEQRPNAEAEPLGSVQTAEDAPQEAATAAATTAATAAADAVPDAPTNEADDNVGGELGRVVAVAPPHPSLRQGAAPSSVAAVEEEAGLSLKSQQQEVVRAAAAEAARVVSAEMSAFKQMQRAQQQLAELAVAESARAKAELEALKAAQAAAILEATEAAAAKMVRLAGESDERYSLLSAENVALAHQIQTVTGQKDEMGQMLSAENAALALQIQKVKTEASQRASAGGGGPGLDEQLSEFKAALTAEVKAQLQAEFQAARDKAAAPRANEEMRSEAIAARRRLTELDEENTSIVGDLRAVRGELSRVLKPQRPGSTPPQTLVPLGDGGAGSATAAATDDPSRITSNDVDILLSHMGVQTRFAIVRAAANQSLGLQLSFDESVLPNGVRVTGLSGPAAASGTVRLNDTVVEVNGQSMMDASHGDVVRAIQNARGDLGLLLVDGDALSAAYAPYLEAGGSDSEGDGLDDDELAYVSTLPSLAAHRSAPVQPGGAVDLSATSPTDLRQQSPHRVPAGAGGRWAVASSPALDATAEIFKTSSHPGIVPLHGPARDSEEFYLRKARELEAVNIRRTQELAAANAVKDHTLRQAQESEAANRRRLAELETVNKLLSSNLEEQTKLTELAAASRTSEMARLSGQLASATEQEVELTRLKGQLAAAAAQQAEVDRLQRELEAAKASGAELEAVRAELTDTKQHMREAEKKRHEDELVRRKLHHKLQELKGNIRVCCRVRPFIGDEAMELPFDRPGPVICPDHSTDRILVRENWGTPKEGRALCFSFARIFAPASTQADVFEEVCEVVQSAMDGYNVCIFAYGQTGAGKTHTMEGGAEPAAHGIIPRTVREVFRQAAEMADKGWTYTLVTSFLEIYNDTIRDLLHADYDGGPPEPKHTVFNDAKTREDVVSGIISQVVTSEAEVFEQLAAAAAKRAVGSTKMNAQSSRSHSIFRVQVTGANRITGDSCSSTLNLVDLAGSERLSRSGVADTATGKALARSDFDNPGSAGPLRLKETQNINKSLAALSNVMLALQRKKEHVPYRNSKLTHVLQNSLGGNSKSIMIVNVSPTPESVGETVCSLRFAATVNNVELGKAQRQAAPQTSPKKWGVGNGGGKRPTGTGKR
jgi:kinesin family protein C1